MNTEINPKYSTCDYCKAYQFGYSKKCMFCDTPLTEISKEDFDSAVAEAQRNTIVIGKKCKVNFGEGNGDILRNAVVIAVDDKNKTYTVEADGLGFKISNIPFSIWRPIV
jgi:hypothetical protein